MGAVRSALSWVLALFLIMIFLQATFHPLPNPPAGQVKFFDLPGENIVFQTIAEKSRFPIFEPTVRVLVGVAEVLAAILLLLPFSRRLGAMLAIGILAGALLFHVSPWLGINVPLSLEPGAPTDEGSLFYLAIASFVASIALFFIHPRSRRS